MKKVLFIMCALFALVASSEAQSYRNAPVRKQYTTPETKSLPQQQYIINAPTTIQSGTINNHAGSITNTPVPMNYQNPLAQPQANTRSVVYNDKGKRFKRPAGDYLVLSGRWEKAALWSGILGGAAAGGLYYYSTTDGCKDQKAFKTAAIATAGATAAMVLISLLNKAHYKIKAGKRMNVGIGMNGAELSYNF